MNAPIDEWLERLGLSSYAPLFAEHAIDLDVLGELTEDDLKELGIPLGDRKRLLRAISRDAPLQQAVPPSKDVSATPEAEKRHLSVMFCDLVGSTRLAEVLDGETLRRVIRDYQEVCSGAISRFGGFLAKYTGDGVLAYFGYPVAHEDDGARAVHAGLAIVSGMAALNQRLAPEHSLNLQVRIGIHAGPVVAGEMGSGETREALAIVGETPNIAARLEGLAEPDTVLISEAIQDLVGTMFELEALGPQTLKGVTEPVSVHRVIGEGEATSRSEATAAVSRAPLVGREEELSLLTRRWEMAKEGESQVVLLSAEAGVGKSRLLRGLHDQLAGEDQTRILYFGSPYHTNSAFHVTIDQLRRALRLQRDDDDDARSDKLERLLADLGMEVDVHAPALASLIGFYTEERYGPATLTPAELKSSWLQTSVEIIRASAAREPVLIAVEDAQWVDPSTLELLSHVMDQVTDEPVLFVITFRPEFDPPWESRDNAASLKLGRLGRKAVEQLAAEVAAENAIPASLVEQIVQRADGVPLFVEELTKSVIETGMADSASNGGRASDSSPEQMIPASLQDSLTARLDRLAPVKEIAQFASAIGRTFSRELLLAAGNFTDAQVDDAFAQLIEAELIYRRGLPPSYTYEFKHALVRDSAYQSLLDSRRRQFHLQIAEALVEGFPVIANAEPELVARHYTEAESRETATPWFLAAAQNAHQSSAYQEVIEHCRQGLAIIGQSPPSGTSDRLKLDFSLILALALTATQGFANTETGEIYTEAEALADRIGDFQQSYAAHWGRWLVLQHTGNTDAALEKADQLVKLATDNDDKGYLLQAHHSCWTSLFANEALQPVLDHTEVGIALYDVERHGNHAYLYGGHDPGCCARIVRALTLSVVGRTAEAGPLVQEGLDIADEIEHPYTNGLMASFAGTVALFARDLKAVRARADEAEVICNKYGIQHFAAMSPVLRGWATAAGGDPAAGIEEMTPALDRLKTTGVRISFAMALKAEACLWAGEKDDGLASIADAFDMIEKANEHRWEPEVHRLKGELLQLDGETPSDPAETETAFLRAIELANEQGALLFELRAVTSFARYLHSIGHPDRAREFLAPAYDRFPKMTETPDLLSARSVLEQLA